MSNHSLKHAALIAALLAVTCTLASPVSASTLQVGPTRALNTPCAAFAKAANGDTIEIDAATYSGDVCGVYASNLIIKGVNGRPRIDAAGRNAMGKGTWVVEGNDITVSNVEMLGAVVPDNNGAALRLEGNNFTLIGSFLHDNQDGILANPVATSNIDIETTEFGHNGAGDGYSHNLYIGNVASLVFRYNYSHDANVGHNLKSRAQLNTVSYNRFSSTPAGQAGSTASGQPSYELDFPNAGTTYVIGNVVEQPAANQNPAMLAYGEEGSSNTAQDLYVVNNTFLNDDSSRGTFLMIGGSVTTPVLMQNNIFGGTGTVSTQANAIDRTNFRSTSPGFVNRATYDLHPTDAMVVNAGSMPGLSAKGVSLVPTSQYQHPAFGETRPVDAKLDIGAYEAASGSSTTPAPTPSPVPVAPAPPVSSPTWMVCATEGGTCVVPGTTQVRYGASGSYFTKTATSTIACTNDVFGDPALGTVKACSYAVASTPAPTPAPPPAPTPAPSGWTDCATENGTCNFTGTRVVRFGANGAYASQTATSTIGCNNTVFGDPAYGVVKSCQYAAASSGTPTPTWSACASENGTCAFQGTRQVRYGANGNYAYKTAVGSLNCSNDVFGDPVYGVVKTCDVSSIAQ